LFVVRGSWFVVRGSWFLVVMRVEEFHKHLVETGSYRTDPALVHTRMSRLFARFDAWYFTRVFFTVVSGAAVAKRGGYDTKAWASSSVAILRAVEQCGALVTVTGMDNVTGVSGPVVYVANHMSMLETMLLPSIVLSVGDVSIVIKESLLQYPFFGAILRVVGPISVSRKDARQDLREVLVTGSERLAAGRSVLIFPQATRSVEFNPGRFNSLGVKLAARAGVPVVPLALKTDFQGNGRIIKDFGPIDRTQAVRFSFGKPLKAEGNAREAYAGVVEFIGTQLREWGMPVIAPNTV